MRLPVVNEELARRIQRSEIEFFHSRISSISERSNNIAGVEIKRAGNAIAFYIQSMPWGLFNSVKGYSDEDIDRLEEVMTFYRERERRFQLEIDPIGVSPKLFRHLSESGLFQEGFHSVLYGLPGMEAPELPPEIKIRQIYDEHEFDHFAGIHCVGSGMDIIHKHHFANNNIGLLNRPGWRLYLAYWKEEPAAVAVMYGSGNIASLTLAATAPQFRRNGLQTSLLKWRMHEAYKAGYELVVAQASFGSQSQNNMERVGLQMAWTRGVWIPH
ncbi:N-acetyltransferase [Paenibacillus paeoniae]|uniref:N-acetyltransferase n=1 Tax=Paenibacillus paeoniae TaxID=2292705 RepID=A0A371PLH2_9BACL|nr:N-acetyltransferase [Paenibacillus paeoniae]REK76835.1 N-acetyltransferase [Paenibacillus paeoniae]